MYCLLDDVVDGYFSVVDEIDAYYEDASDWVFADHPLRPDQQRDWFEMRRTLSQFRRLVVPPLREALSGVLRHDTAMLRPEVLPYWQDLYDHVVVVSETTDALRDLAASLVDANLALRDYRQNQVMKTVSSWAAIVAAPTLVTGYFGMNVPFPGSGETVGRDLVRRPDHRHLADPLPTVPPPRLALSRYASAASDASGTSDVSPV